MLAFFLFGIGIGTMNTPITRTAVSGMPDSQAGVAAAMASTSRQVGATLGVAVVGSLLNSGLHGRSLAVGFEDASPIGWWVILGCSAATLLLGPLISSARAESIVAPKSRQPDRAEFAASLET
jgi:MFS family permease